MGQSPSADVYWGYDLGDLTDRETWRSLKPAWWDPTNAPDFDADNDEAEFEAGSAEYQAYRASSDRKRELLATIPVEIATYGYSEGEPCFALRVKPSVQHVYDWGSIALEPLVVDPTWPEHLTRFTELLELTVPEDGPTWHLNCSYG